MNSLERVVGLQEAKAFVEAVKASGGTVALTNGCFDLIHAGHVSLLEHARAAASALVVGVNTDESVRQLKGPGRPINPEADRARVVAALRPVDRVVLFSERTAERLILELQPDVYVKGADYDLDTLPEREAVRALGCRVLFVPLVAGRSTTEMAQRLDRAFPKGGAPAGGPVVQGVNRP